MELGISGQALGRTKGLEEILQVLRENKVSAIEVWPMNFPVLGDPVKHQVERYEGRRIEDAKDLLRKYGIKAACVTMSGGFDERFAGDIQEYAAALRYAVEVAQELGAKIVNHYCYHLSLEENPNIRDLMVYFEPAIRKAEELGITLALENEAHDATRTPDGMLKIIQAVGSKHFQTNFDPCNYYHASQEGFPYAYEVLKDHIAYVHLKNGCIYNPQKGHAAESKGTPMTGRFAPNYIYYPPIPEGAVNVDGLLGRLVNDGYKGFCTLEPHTTPDHVERYYREEISYLRSRGFFAQE